MQLCSGGMHTIALTKSGEVLSWGCNDEGGLGRDTPEDEDCFLPGKVRIIILVSKTANFDNDNIYMYYLDKKKDGLLNAHLSTLKFVKN